MLKLTYTKASVCASPARVEEPTIVPEQLIALAWAMLPPSVPKSSIPIAESQRKASTLPSNLAAVPTTWPLQLFPKAKLLVPPSVPRSKILKLGSHVTA